MINISSTLENDLAKYKVYDAWQFVLNTQKNLLTANYCSSIINNSIQIMNTEHKNWQNDIFENLFDGSSKTNTFSLTAENLPGYEVEILGEKVSYPFLIDKLTKDFFQYVRNSFDSMAQILNSALLANRGKSRTSVDFPCMLRTFNQQMYSQSFPDALAWLNTVDSSFLFKYIDDFNNRTKHTFDVNLKLEMSLFDGNSNTDIDKFYKKDRQQQDTDILTIINDVYVFANQCFEDLLKVITNNIPIKLYATDRFHHLSCYQQKLQDTSNSNLSVIFIKEDDVSSLPNEIRVLLLSKVEDDFRSKNSHFKNIFIRNSSKEYIAQYTAKSFILKEDNMLEYIVYESVPYIGHPALFDAFQEGGEKFYNANPYVSTETVSDDEDFLHRVQLPF